MKTLCTCLSGKTICDCQVLESITSDGININRKDMKEGQKVMCVSEDFPLIKKYGGTGEEADSHPKKGEVLGIDEVLGDFLRFDKYDTDQSFNWWKLDRFIPIDEFEMEESFKELISTVTPLKS